MRTLFFHFLCNRLIIRDAFLCFLYTVGLIHDVFITCYFTTYKVTIFFGYDQKKMAIILQIEQANGDFFAICKLEMGKGN